jgi:hypothetical protein
MLDTQSRFWLLILVDVVPAPATVPFRSGRKETVPHALRESGARAGYVVLAASLAVMTDRPAWSFLATDVAHCVAS